MTRKQAPAPMGRWHRGIALAFGVALVLGGGAGRSYPLLQMIVEGLAIAVILLNLPDRAARAVPAWRLYTVLLGAIGVVLGLQLVPLPPGIWHGLGGHDLAATLYDTLGWAGRWRPLSLTPDATVRAATALLPIIAAFVVTARLGLEQRLLALRVVVAFAVASTVLAAIQVAAGADAPVLYATAQRGAGVGLFVNRNHQAAFLLVALVLAAIPGVVRLPGAPRPGRAPDARLAIAALAGFLALGVLATSSRTGLALLLPVLLVAGGLVLGTGGSRRWPIVAAAGAAIVMAALLRTEIAGRALSRFGPSRDELRFQYWENTIYGIGQAMPWGTGVGSFDPVYRTLEPLGQVSPLYVNHAHNDYLEIALELGVPGVILMASGLAAIVAALVLAWRAGPRRRPLVVGAGAGIAIVLGFCVIDYPLRMALIGGLFGLLLALPMPSPPARPSDRARRRAIGTVLPGVLALLAGAVVVSGGLADALVRRGLPQPATRVAPWLLAPAWSSLADAEQLAGHAAASRAAAARALAIQPLDASAVRAYGFAQLALGAAPRGADLLELGAALGWRDNLTQLWLIDRAAAAGRYDISVERIDAMVRRRQGADGMLAILRQFYRLPAGRTALLARLAEGPHWRTGFLYAVSPDLSADVPGTLRFLAALRSAGAPASPAETALVRWRLADSGQMADARRVWLASGGRGWIGDPGFEAGDGPLARQAAPYVWAVPDTAGLTVGIADTGAGSPRSVEIASNGFGGGVALAQTISLPPGRYDVGLTTQITGSAEIALQLACIDRGGPTVVPIALRQIADAVAGWRRLGGGVAMPRCAGAALLVLVDPAPGVPATIRIDDVAIGAAATGQTRPSAAAEG